MTRASASAVDAAGAARARPLARGRGRRGDGPHEPGRAHLHAAPQRLGLHRRRPRRPGRRQGRLGERGPRLPRRPDLRGDPSLPSPAAGRRPARGPWPEAADGLRRLLPGLRTAARERRRGRGAAPRRRREPDRLAARQRAEPDGLGRPPCARALRDLPVAPVDAAPCGRIPADPRDLVRRLEGRPLPAGVVCGADPADAGARQLRAADRRPLQGEGRHRGRPLHPIGPPEACRDAATPGHPCEGALQQRRPLRRPGPRVRAPPAPHDLRRLARRGQAEHGHSSSAARATCTPGTRSPRTGRSGSRATPSSSSPSSASTTPSETC